MNLPSPGDHVKSRRLRSAVVLGVLLLVLLALPFVLPSFYLFVATRILALGLFATAFNIVFGFGGMPSLGHAAFFGLGAYVVGIASTRSDLPFVVIVVLTLVAGTALGVVFGLFNLRAKGIYLLLLTLALAQAAYGLAFQQVELTGGDNGISGITREGVPIPGSASAFYWLALAMVVVSLSLMWAFMRSPVGMAITGLRESESRLAATGYRVGSYRVYAFAVSGAFSAVAGLLDAYLLGSASPSNMAFLLSAEVMVFAILGGAAFFFGPFLGAAVILSLELYVSTLTSRWTFVLGIVYVLTALFMSDGILGRIAYLRRRARRKTAESPTRAAAGETDVAVPADTDDLVEERHT
ncbi:branched-chain amino acid transport system permease protein [Modestobacter sp. DSM 44400]|uniref:branched-chain amino acid ABC transporter permease n=1 Tax=Modestobacter sp. DSM 44400 TaxID=1550230 RepID=UPI00089D0529|nr:branched-chain amino acid ABC transporter permease [Modestobacter sp. DSM 44400]SDX80220.1 branched-chain amino acid transport system permease protein [Modestobacter sp. DSM 44400]